MSGAHSLTREQAASLRCYLAVSDLAAYALDGKQLSPESLVSTGAPPGRSNAPSQTSSKTPASSKRTGCCATCRHGECARCAWSPLPSANRPAARASRAPLAPLAATPRLCCSSSPSHKSAPNKAATCHLPERSLPLASGLGFLRRSAERPWRDQCRCRRSWIPVAPFRVR